MSTNLIEHATGNYKSEWDAPATPDDLPPVPDYEEIMIWDKKSPGRSGSDLEDDITNPEDGVVGDFENPGFWDFQGDGGFLGGDRTNGMDGDDEENINGRQIGKRSFLKQESFNVADQNQINRRDVVYVF